MQADPLGLIAGLNVFGYALQNPMRFIDPDGRNPLVIGVIGAIVGGGVGYFQTGCIEGLLLGAWSGFGAGLGASALGVGVYGADVAAGTSGVLSDIAVTIGTDGLCGCRPQKLDWTRSILIFAGGALMGPLAGSAGRSIGARFGAIGSDVGEAIGGGISGEFGAQVGNDMASDR